MRAGVSQSSVLGKWCLAADALLSTSLGWRRRWIGALWERTEFASLGLRDLEAGSCASAG